MRDTRVLFLCKNRGYGPSFGLSLSARFVSEALRSVGIHSKVATVVDGNAVDKEVHDYKPTHVIIEALWVTPEKLEELVRLHPKVNWVVRIHSEIPFISNEGIAFDWMFKYQNIRNVSVSSNSDKMNEDLRELKIRSVYLPNIYFPAFRHDYTDDIISDCSESINVGCFGAIRPLKNQLDQAAAAIVFANNKNIKLRFHINSSRVEQDGSGALKNMRSLFKNSHPHRLIEHEWMKHDDFVRLVRSMDLGMQVSFSETFNIVTADFVDNGVPIVVSNEVSWMPFWTKADTNDINDIASVMAKCYRWRRFGLQKINRLFLVIYNHRSLRDWLKYL